MLREFFTDENYDPTTSVTYSPDGDTAYYYTWVAGCGPSCDRYDVERDSYLDALHVVHTDDEDWGYEVQLRICRAPSFYKGNLRLAAEDNNLDTVYWTPGTPAVFQDRAHRSWPRTYRVPFRFLAEVAGFESAVHDAYATREWMGADFDVRKHKTLMEACAADSHYLPEY